MDNKEIAYLILQHKYFETLGLQDLEPDQLIEKFPSNWELLNIDTKIEIISEAIKSKQELDIVMEQIKK